MFGKILKGAMAAKAAAGAGGVKKKPMSFAGRTAGALSAMKASKPTSMVGPTEGAAKGFMGKVAAMRKKKSGAM